MIDTMKGGFDEDSEVSIEILRGVSQAQQV